MGVVQEFKAFVLRGNVVDLAVGVVIGAAFGKVVDSLVKDVFMPVIGLLLGGFDVSRLSVTLWGDAAIHYGSFLQTVLNFLIIGLCLFLVVKGMNRLQRKVEAKAPDPTPTPAEKLLVEIRDELRAARQ